jgi:arsenate reductase-like glutaredoxin family protein
MIKRPILENKGKVLAFGFDEEQFKKIIKSL